MLRAFGDVDWALARFSQNEGVDQSCLDDQGGPTAWYECNTWPARLPHLVRQPAVQHGHDIPTGRRRCPFNWPAYFAAGCQPGTGRQARLCACGRWVAAAAPTSARTTRASATRRRRPRRLLRHGRVRRDGQHPRHPQLARRSRDQLRHQHDHRQLLRLGGTGDCELRPEGRTPLAGLLASVRATSTPDPLGGPARELSALLGDPHHRRRGDLLRSLAIRRSHAAVAPPRQTCASVSAPT